MSNLNSALKPNHAKLWTKNRCFLNFKFALQIKYIIINIIIKNVPFVIN